MDIADGLRAHAGGNLGTGDAYEMRYGSGSRFPQSGWRRAYYSPSGRPPSGLQLLDSDEAIVAAVFASILPTFLVIFWSFAVLIWLLVVAFSSPISPQRSLRSEARTLAVFTWLGFALMVWQLLGFFIPIGMVASKVPGLYVTVFMTLILVWGWLLWLALCIAWVYEWRWSKKNAHGQTQQSMKTLVSQDTALDFNTYAGNKEWDSDHGHEQTSYNAYRVPFDTTYASEETEVTPFQHAGPSVPTDAKGQPRPYADPSIAPVLSASPADRRGEYMRVHNV